MKRLNGRLTQTVLLISFGRALPVGLAYPFVAIKFLLYHCERPEKYEEITDLRSQLPFGRIVQELGFNRNEAIVLTYRFNSEAYHCSVGVS